MIGAKLRMARTAAGLSLRELAEAIESRVSAQAISKYERDEDVPGSATLMALASKLGVAVDYLLGEQSLTLEGVEFRKKPSASRKEEAQVEARVLHRLEQYLFIEELLGLESITWDRPRSAPYPVKTIHEADRAARGMREHWGLGHDSIPNLVELLEERGIKVICEPLAEAIDGMTAHVRRGGELLPVIVVNAQHSGERQRFTLAHELGHNVIQPDPKLSENEIEKASHRFAGTFLMPADVLWSEIGKHRTDISIGELLSLKELLGVSAQALVYRCLDLDIIGPRLFRRLFDEFRERGWRSPPYQEPRPVPAEKAQRLERLCLRALSEGALSEPRAAEILGLSVRELDHLLSGRLEEQARAA